MKRVSNIYHKVYDINNINNMCDLVCSKVKNKEKAEKFMLYKAEHIINIKNKLISKNIDFSNYSIFLITDPKCRLIMSQSIVDKVINHLIAKYLLVDVYENIYTNSMCATRINKGSSYGIKLLKKYLNKNKYKYNNFYYLKLDIKKYLFNNLKLELNDKKTKIDSIRNGIDFLGYRFIIKNNNVIMKLRVRTKYNFKRKVKDLKKLLDNKYINKINFKNLLSSYKRLLMHRNCNNLYYSYTDIRLK